MVKCPECGENLAETDNACPSCGKSMPKNNDANDNNKDSSKGISNKILIVIAIIVVIAIVGVLASGMLSGDNSSSGVNQDTNAVKPIQEANSSDSDSSSGSTEYWASAKADKFHRPTCEWAEKIGDANKIVYHSREDAIEDGKIPCGVCNP